MVLSCSGAGRAITGLWMGTLLLLASPGEVHAGLNQWTSGGPLGASVVALASDPLSPMTVYAASNGPGMFKSTDGGGSWVPVNSGITNLVIRAVALNRQVPTTLYAGTSGGGIFKSTDGGASWVPSSVGLTNTVVTALAVDPQTPTTIYTGTNHGGVFKSTDGGASWDPVNAGLSNTTVTSLAVDPQTPTTLYAGTAGGGVFRSTTGGSAWQPVNGGITNTVVSALAIDPLTPSIVYAGTNGGGVFKSLNGGSSWAPVNGGLVNSVVTALAIDPQTSATLYAGTTGSGVFTSLDAGAHWAPLNTGLGDTSVNALAVTLTGTCLHAGTNRGEFDLALIDQVCSPSPLIPPSRLINISTRALVGTGDGVTIGGFIITGPEPKTVLIRARGPSLAAFGILDVLPDPFLRIFSGQTAIAENDSWQTPLPLCQASGFTCGSPSDITATGLAPDQAAEPAILITLPPGPYTAIVSGAGGTTGVAIVEVFEVDGASPSQLVNVSTRGLVELGDDVMIGGFVIGGTLPMKVLIRGAGPSLANFGVPGVLPDPFLQIFAGQSQIAQNDSWQATLPLCQATGHTCGSPADIAATGLAPTDSRESAIVITLTPGPYTAILSGVGATTGIGIVEVFAVQ